MTFDALVIGYDQPASRVVSRLLESIGATVRIAPTSAIGMAGLRHQPMLVILDASLPGDSLLVLKAIRRMGLRCKVAVIASEGSKSLKELTSLNPDAIFGGPLKIDDFVDWISLIFTESISLDPSVLPE